MPAPRPPVPTLAAVVESDLVRDTAVEPAIEEAAVQPEVPVALEPFPSIEIASIDEDFQPEVDVEMESESGQSTNPVEDVVDAPIPVEKTSEPEVERDPGHFPTPPIYFGTVRLHDWKTTARGGMSVDVGVLDTPPTGLHPFKGLYCGKQNGQRLRVWFGNVGDEAGDVEGLHAGEALLMRWSDDSINGMSVKILLDDGPDGVSLHPFTGLPTGRSEGEKLQLAAWAVSDSEKLLDPRQTRKRVPFYELSEIRQAHILCGEPRFISYLKRHEARLSRGKPVQADILTHSREYATEIIYAYLKIESRKVLNQDNAEGRRAQKYWASLLKEYYDDFYNRR
jgi:hypothetical protein